MRKTKIVGLLIIIFTLCIPISAFARTVPVAGYDRSSMSLAERGEWVQNNIPSAYVGEGRPSGRAADTWLYTSIDKKYLYYGEDQVQVGYSLLVPNGCVMLMKL